MYYIYMLGTSHTASPKPRNPKSPSNEPQKLQRVYDKSFDIIFQNLTMIFKAHKIAYRNKILADPLYEPVK